MRSGMILALQVLWLAGQFAAPAQVVGAKLEPEAVQEFDRYVRVTEEHMRAESRQGAPFLWVDSLAQARRPEQVARLHHGDVITERLETRDSADPFQTPGALIHHWIGTIFIPGASLQKVLTLLRDYDHHSMYYRPDVTRSKMLENSGDDFKVYLRLTQKKIITVTLDTEYEVHYSRLDMNRAESRSYSTRIVEVEHAGEPNEHAMPEENDDGFLWRLYSYWRFSEADGGAYVQCEAISLTRSIPTGLNWLIGPFVDTVPRESLEFTLRSTRAAVLRGHMQASR